MSTTEEIIAKYRLDLDELKTQVGELEKQYGRADDAAKKSAENADKSFNKLGDTLKTFGKQVLAAFAVERIVAFGKASVQAFAEAEKGALKLRSAVTATGGLEKDFKALTEQAETLAGITIFDDDAIKAAQTMALQFGLNASAVQKLIPKVADFAAATGQDLQQALQATLGGINGQVDGLKRYGFQLETTSTRNERFGQVVEQLTTKFNGQAEALTNTLGGSLGQAEKAFGELQESIGEALAPAVIAASEAVTELFDALTKAPPDPLVEQVAGLEAYRAKLFDVNTTQEERKGIILKLQEIYPEYLGNLDAEKTSNEQLNDALNLVTDELVDQLVIKQQTNKVDEKQAELNEARAKVAEKEGAVAELLAKARAEGIKVEEKYVSLTDRARRAVELLGQKADKSGFGAAAYLNALATNLNEQALGIGSFTGGLVQKLEDVKDAEKELQAQQVTRTTVLQELGLSAQNYTKIEQTALDALIAKGDQLAKQENERRKAAAAKAGPGKTGLEKETEAEKKAREDRAAAAQKEADAKAKAAADAAAKQAAEELKVREELAKTGLEQDLQNLENYNAASVLAIEKRYADEQNLRQANADQELADLQRQLEAGLITWAEYEKRKAAISAAVGSNEQARAEALLRQEISNLELQIQNRKDYGQEVNDQENQLAAKREQLRQLEVKGEKQASDEKIAAWEKETQEREALLEKQREQQKKNNEATIESINTLLDSSIQLLNQESENRIKTLEDQKDQQGQQYDEEQAKLQEQYDRRLISQQVYEQRSAELKQKRVDSENVVNKKINEIKAAQDKAAKLQAIFRIGVDTARAITAQLAETPLPGGAFFVAAIAASGLLQLKAVTSASPPQYAEGVDWVPLGKNRRGRDTIPAMLDEGERVVSRRKNLRHWDLYQAIDEDRLPDYIWKNYTHPALERERASGGAVVRALAGALNPTGSSAAGGSSDELRKLWRRGLNINNLSELAQLLDRQRPSPYRN